MEPSEGIDFDWYLARAAQRATEADEYLEQGNLERARAHAEVAQAHAMVAAGEPFLIAGPEPEAPDLSALKREGDGLPG